MDDLQLYGKNDREIESQPLHGQFRRQTREVVDLKV